MRGEGSSGTTGIDFLPSGLPSTYSRRGPLSFRRDGQISGRGSLSVVDIPLILVGALHRPTASRTGAVARDPPNTQ